MKLTIYPHYTDCPPAAATLEACRLLDLGLAPLLFVPPEGAGACAEFLPKFERVKGDRQRDYNLVNEWKQGESPLLICERLPSLITDFGPHKHIFLVCIGYDFNAHRGVLTTLTRMNAPLRLHLFLNPAGNTDPRLAKMLPAGFENDPVREEPDIDLDHMLHWSSMRFHEFHPILEKPLRKDDFVPLTAQDLKDAVSAINLPSPSDFEISTRRFKNVKKKGK
jgi:hypothetical protein